MRRRFVWHAGEWVDVTDWKRPPRKTPYIVRDGMDALLNHANGQVYDSKSAFRRATRDAGCVEVGNDAPLTLAPRDYRPAVQDVAEAVQMLNQGYQPPPLETVSEAFGSDYRLLNP